MNEPKQKPVYGMKNELHTKLVRVLWELDEANEAVKAGQIRADEALKALEAILSEDGAFFHGVRCESCRTSWIDDRSNPTVTHCPMCGKKAE